MRLNVRLFNKGYKFINKVKCDKNIFVNKLAKNTKIKIR